MTPLNITLAVTVLVLVALLWKLRRDRAGHDAGDDLNGGGWATAAPGGAAPAAGAAPAGARPQPGASWVVGGSAGDGDGPAAAVSDPGWPRPGQMSGVWPPAGAPSGVEGPAGTPPGVRPLGAPPAAAADGWDQPLPAADATDWLTPAAPDAAGRPPADAGPRGPVAGDPPATPDEIPAATPPAAAPAGAAGPPGDGDDAAPVALPLWTPPAAADAAVRPSLRAVEADADLADAWPMWDPAADADDRPPAAPPEAAGAANPSAAGEAGAPAAPDDALGGPIWDDAPAMPAAWGDPAGRAVAEHAATVADEDPPVAAAAATAAADPTADVPAGPAVGAAGAPSAGAPGEGPEAGRGRFALGGHAMRAGQQAVCGVTFRRPVAAPPTAWAVAPAPGVAPGTLVLHLGGAVNCGVDGLQVVMDEGFAPTAEGFTVRIAARAPGPFLASGTFEIAA